MFTSRAFSGSRYIDIDVEVLSSSFFLKDASFLSRSHAIGLHYPQSLLDELLNLYIIQSRRCSLRKIGRLVARSPSYAEDGYISTTKLDVFPYLVFHIHHNK